MLIVKRVRLTARDTLLLWTHAKPPEQHPRLTRRNTAKDKLYRNRNDSYRALYTVKPGIVLVAKIDKRPRSYR
jgi:mRNA-degrading endonuclease RelE of RelBE toxin-antitoxin system